MTIPATAHVLALVATACSHVVYGDSIHHHANQTADVVGPVFQFDFDPVGGLPSQDQLIVLSKWSPAELNSFADFFLLSPRSPRHKKRAFSFRRSSSTNLNFTACDADTT